MKIFPLNVTHLLYRRTWRVSYKHSIPFCTSWKFPWRNISPSVSFSSIFISSFTVTHKTHWRTLRVSQTFAFYISINYTIMTIIMTINVERGFSSFYFGTINSFFFVPWKKNGPLFMKIRKGKVRMDFANIHSLKAEENRKFCILSS